MEMEESIEKFCKPTASQEAKFPKCPLARESEILLESHNEDFSSFPDFTPSEATGIVVLSLPDSPCSVEQHTVDEDAVFVTPPEHHHISQLPSSEDQNPNDLRAQHLTVAEAKEETEARVLEIGLDDQPQEDTLTVERGEEFDGDTVPLGENEVIVGEAGSVSIVREIGGDAIDGNHELGQNMEGIAVSPKEAKKPKQSDTSGGVESRGKRIEEIDEFWYVDGVSSRKLPPSLMGKEKEKEKIVVESSEEKSKLFDLLDRFVASTKDGGCDSDFMETAKRKGIEIPRPRWWPSEDDEDIEFFV